MCPRPDPRGGPLISFSGRACPGRSPVSVVQCRATPAIPSSPRASPRPQLPMRPESPSFVPNGLQHAPLSRPRATTRGTGTSSPACFRSPDSPPAAASALCRSPEQRHRLLNPPSFAHRAIAGIFDSQSLSQPSCDLVALSVPRQTKFDDAIENVPHHISQRTGRVDHGHIWQFLESRRIARPLPL